MICLDSGVFCCFFLKWSVEPQIWDLNQVCLPLRSGLLPHLHGTIPPSAGLTSAQPLGHGKDITFPRELPGFPKPCSLLPLSFICYSRLILQGAASSHALPRVCLCLSLCFSQVPEWSSITQAAQLLLSNPSTPGLVPASGVAFITPPQAVPRSFSP